MACDFYGKGKVIVGEKSPLHEAGLLMLNIEKAKTILGWTPTLTAKQAIQNTIEWYKHFYNKDTDMFKFTIEQIKEYESKISWNRK